MHYLIYKVTNLVNDKIYIGKHITENINDDYLGSGKILRRAIEKYGIDKFKKEILYDFTEEHLMNEIERKIVDEDFIKRLDVYNINTGGKGSWDNVNDTLTNEDRTRIGKLGGNGFKNKLKTDKDFSEKFRNQCSIRLKETHRQGKIRYNTFTGKHHTEEFKKKQSERMLARIKEKGHNRLGTKWMYNLQIKKSISIKKEEIDKYLKEGWILGRKMFFD